jgi:hypothetical protein
MNITTLSIVIFIAVVVIGLLAILKAKQGEQDEIRAAEGQAMGKGIGIGIGIGMPIGLVIGIAMDNIPIGISLGPALGVGLGTAIGARLQAKARAEAGGPPREPDALTKKSTVTALIILVLGVFLLGFFFLLKR